MCVVAVLTDLLTSFLRTVMREMCCDFDFGHQWGLYHEKRWTNSGLNDEFWVDQTKNQWIQALLVLCSSSSTFFVNSTFDPEAEINPRLRAHEWVTLGPKNQSHLACIKQVLYVSQEIITCKDLEHKHVFKKIIT